MSFGCAPHRSQRSSRDSPPVAPLVLEDIRALRLRRERCSVSLSPITAVGWGGDAYAFTSEGRGVRPVADAWRLICRVPNIGCRSRAVPKQRGRPQFLEPSSPLSHPVRSDFIGSVATVKVTA